MSDKELMARGAECIAGELVLRRKTVGRYRNGQFILTPEGQAELQIVDVEAKPAGAATPDRERKPAKTTKPAKPAKPAAPSPVDPAPSLDDLTDIADLQAFIDAA